jgi:hypothetical protein
VVERERKNAGNEWVYNSIFLEKNYGGTVGDGLFLALHIHS